MKHHLTLLKIIVCCLLFFCIPLLTDQLTLLAESRTIALTLSISTAAMFLIFTNHQLAALHFKRFLANLKENAIYAVFSALYVCALFYLGQRFFLFESEIIDFQVLSQYPFFAPLILITYTFSYSFCFNIVFKLLTDKLHFKSGPYITILVSGLLFGVFLSLSQFALLPTLKGQFDLLFFTKGLIMNFLISLCTSYCYNQTSSIVSMTLGFTAALMIIQFL